METPVSHGDWSTPKIIKVCLALQLAFWGIIGISLLGYDIPGVRQFVVFLYLTLVPGILILRTLRIHEQGLVRTLLYSAGLSILFLITAGLILNTVLPVLGYYRPISMIPLSLWLSALVIVLSVAAYVRERRYVPPSSGVPNMRQNSNPALFLIWLLCITVLGALLVAYRGNNVLLIIAVAAIGALPIGLTFTKFIPGYLFSLVVGVLTLAVMYQMTLTSPFLSGGSDIYLENFFLRTVMANGYWDPSIAHNYNSALSITILGPIYSLLSGVESTWILKTFYPLLFAMAAIGLYEVFRRQFGDRISLFACYLFISLIPVTAIYALARQQVAEFFLVLALVAMLDNRLSRFQSGLFLTLFLISVVISHYALSYIFVGILLIGYLQILVIRSNRASRCVCKILPGLSAPIQESSARPSALYDLRLLGLYVGAFLVWIMVVSEGSVFATIVSNMKLLISNLPHFLSLAGREAIVGTALGLDWANASALGRLFRIVQYLVQLFVVVGICSLYFRRNKHKLNASYLALTNAALLLLLASIALPYFADRLNLVRVYHIAMLFLSPFCVLGAMFLWTVLSRAVTRVAGVLKSIVGRFAYGNSTSFHPGYGRALLLTFCFLLAYFLFNTGFIFEVAGAQQKFGDLPTSIALSSARIDGIYFTTEEISAVEWIGEMADDKRVYADWYGRAILQGRVGPWQSFPLSSNTQFPQSYFIFLRSHNIKDARYLIRNGTAYTDFGKAELPLLSDAIDTGHVIYANDRARVIAGR